MPKRTYVTGVKARARQPEQMWVLDLRGIPSFSEGERDVCLTMQAWRHDGKKEAVSMAQGDLIPEILLVTKANLAIPRPDR